MESVVSVVFKKESEGYQALTELKQRPVMDACVVSQAVLMKKAGIQFKVLDAFDTGAETADDTAVGGLIGGLMGIFGGPIGVLLFGSMGALAGSALDTADAVRNASLMEKVMEQFVDGEVAIVALAQETDESVLNQRMSRFETTVVREDAAEVAEEVRQAEQMQREMEQEARKRLREKRKRSGMRRLKNAGRKSRRTSRI